MIIKIQLLKGFRAGGSTDLHAPDSCHSFATTTSLRMPPGLPAIYVSYSYSLDHGIDTLHKWRLNLNNSALYIIGCILQRKDCLREYEA